MADHVGLANTEPKFSRKRKLGKNKKKSWRAVDITATEEFLEDERFQLRTTGLVAEKTNEQLFLIDTTKADTKPDAEERKRRRRQPKPLKCFSNLVNTSKIPCPRAGYPVILKKVPEAVEKRKANSATTRQAIKQRRQALQKRAEELKKKKSPPEFDHDLWQDEKEGEADEFYMDVTKKRRVKPPVKPSPSKQAAVEPPHPGASYNPSYDDHQELLLQAHMVEAKKEKEEQRIFNALDAKFPTRDEAPSQETWLKEMSSGLFEEGDQDEDDQQMGDPDHISVNPPVSSEQRKTRQEKRKALEAKEERRRLLKEKEEKMRENMVHRLRTLQSEIQKDAKEKAARAKMRAKKKEEKKAGTKKLGKVKFENPDLELKLSNELVGSLRQLKPEGHLLEDRYKSLQKRNIIEPRKKVRRTKVKRKMYTKKSHKDV